jgi:hypothetical protein
MALLWIDGFEGYGNTIGQSVSPSDCFARRYTACTATHFAEVADGRLGGFCIYPTNGYWNICTPVLPTTDPTLIVGLAVKLTANASKTVFSLYTNGVQGVNLRTTSAGELAVYRQSTLLGTTTGLMLAIGVWYQIEMKVYCHDTAGTVEVRVNGDPVLVLTDVDTKAGTTSYHNQVQLDGPDVGYVLYYDDFYVLDGAGTENNTFLGDMMVAAVFPNAAGDAEEWMPSAGGEHHTLVGENPANDTDYVESNVSGQRELWNYSALSSVGDYIAGVQINTDAVKTDAGDARVKVLAKSGEAVDVSPPVNLGGGSRLTASRIVERDPATGSRWTISGVSSAQFGVEVN